MQRRTWISLFSIALLTATVFAPALDAQPPDGGRGGDREGGRQGGRGGGFGRGFGGPGGGFGGPGGGGVMTLGLLRIDAVRQEVKVTKDQQELIEILGDELRESRPQPPQNFREASEEERADFTAKMETWNKEEAAQATETLKTILDEGQYTRLREISIQTQGSGALLDTDVAKELKLSEEQLAALKETQETSREEFGQSMREAFQGGGGFDRDAMRERMETYRKETETKMLAHLTDEQKTAYTELKGTDFKMPPEAFGGGFGGGRGGRGGRGPGGPGGGRPSGGGRPQRPE